MPERFDGNTQTDGQEKRPVMLHGPSSVLLKGLYDSLKASLATSSLARTCASESHSVRTNHTEYAEKVFNLLKENNIRAEFDGEDENLGKSASMKNQTSIGL